MIKIKNCTIGEFKRKTKNQRVICFCAGQEFRDLCDAYHLGPKMMYVIDNHSHGTISADGCDIPVISVGEVGGEVEDCILVITSLKYADEIIRQLDEIALFDGLPFYISKLFLCDPSRLNLGEDKPGVIPKVIHYCWFGHGELPKRFCENIETWKRCCPDFRIIRWDESNYDISKNRYMKQAYDRKKWGFVPDYARLDIVHTHGGVYLDTDVELLKPLDSLLSYDMFCGFESPLYVNLGLGFGAKKDSRVLRDMMKVYDAMDFILSDGSLNLTASPTFQTAVLEEYGLTRDGHTQVLKDFIALSPEYMSPINAYGFGHQTEQSFSIHQYASTWYEGGQQKEKGRCADSCRFIMRRMQESE